MSLDNICRVENQLDRLLCTMESEDPRFGQYAVASESFCRLFETYRQMLYLECDRQVIMDTLLEKGNSCEENVVPFKTAPTDEPEPSEEPEEEETEGPTEKTYEFTEVRAILAKAKAERGVDVSALLKSIGAAKLSEVPPEKYTALVAAAEAE